MRPLHLVFGATFVVSAFLLLATLQASPAPAPTPGPTTTADAGPALCLAVLGNLIPLDENAGNAKRYAVTVWTLSDQRGLATGTLALFTANERYDVSFKNVVASILLNDVNASPPVSAVVELPAAVHLERGYISALDANNGGPCSPYTAVTTWQPGISSERPSVFVTAKSIAPIEAPPPAPASDVPCAGPDAPAKMIMPQLEDEPPLAKAQGTRGTTIVEVFLTDDAMIVGAKVTNSSGSDLLDKTTLRVALRSKYSTEISHCRHIGGTYVVRASYEP